MEKEINNLFEACIADYKTFSFRPEMEKEYAEGLSYKIGKKYIKIISKGSAWGFINLENPKFKKGDILMASSWATPALNKARGNIFEDYVVRWTGPCYLR